MAQSKRPQESRLQQRYATALANKILHPSVELMLAGENLPVAWARLRGEAIEAAERAGAITSRRAENVQPEIEKNKLSFDDSHKYVTLTNKQATGGLSGPETEELNTLSLRSERAHTLSRIVRTNEIVQRSISIVKGEDVTVHVAAEYPSEQSAISLPWCFGLPAEQLRMVAALTRNYVENQQAENAVTVKVEDAFQPQLETWCIESEDDCVNALQSLESVQGLTLSVPAPVRKLLDEHYLSRKRRNFENLEGEFEETVRKAQEVTGVLSERIFSKHFRNNARVEEGMAMFWSSFAIALVALLIWLGAKTYDTSVDITWKAELGRLAIALPVVGIAAYCARIASKHRSAGRHSRLAAIQLLTIEGFCDSMSKDDTRELRMLLGTRVFGKPDLEEPAGEGADGNVSLIPEQALDLASKALDAIKEMANKGRPAS